MPANSMDKMLIPPSAKRGRKRGSENEDNKDRISGLPDSVLLHILSFAEGKYAVRTCVLSTRWKDLWKSIPNLILHCELGFLALERFDKFVSSLLTLRDGSIALQGLDFWCCRLDFRCSQHIQSRLLERIVRYAVSHNIQQLALSFNCVIEHFPYRTFSSETLVSLELLFLGWGMLFPKSFNLPALTTLHLTNFAFSSNGNDPCAEPFSAFTRLNSLIIDRCYLSGNARILCISSMTLCNLRVVNDFNRCKFELSSPSLHTFAFTGTPFHTLSWRNLSSIEHVDFSIHMGWEDANTSLILLNWLTDLANIKSLTITTYALQGLSLIPDLLELKVPILGSLKSLKVREVKVSYQKVPDGVVDFLLQNSPSAKVDIIRRSTFDRGAYNY